MTIALCLAGGGSRGIIAAGSIKYLKEIGVKPDAVYAASVGALNGLLYLQDEVQEMERLWLEIENKDVYRSRILSLWTLFTNSASIYDSAPLEKLIRKYFNKVKIDALDIPFIVGTSNISKLKAEIKDIRGMDYEDQLKWVLASASPPVLFPSVSFPILGETVELVDAGICTNYFLTEAIKDGHDTIICISPTNYAAKPPKNLIDIIQATISTASFNYLDREAKAIEKLNLVIEQANMELTEDLKKIRLVIIRPKVPWGQGLIDFNYKADRQQLLKIGYDLAKETLKDF